MRISIIIIFILAFSASVWAADERTIIVGRCTMDVIVMETPAEQAQGLLRYTAKTFEYDGMLFDMGRTGRKYFHTEGMQMPIRIIGVSRSSDGSYKVVTPAYYSPPGVKSIMIAAPDVLEITEPKYQYKFKACLGAAEATAR